MKKRIKRKSSLVVPQDESGVADLIDKMQQQLNAVEKKLDILISQSSKRPFKESYSQKSFRSFDRSNRHTIGRHDRGRQDSGSRERTFTRVVCADCKNECEIPFKPSGDRLVYCKECFSKRRSDSPFSSNRDRRPEGRDSRREHYSDRSESSKRQRPDKKKKSFFARRKKRV